MNLLGDNMDTMKKNTETLIDASNEIGPEANADKTKHMFLFRHQNAGQILLHLITATTFMGTPNS
jgi:hypothetical protein